MTETQIGMAVLVAFASSFLGICIWAFWPSNRSRLKSYGRIPLEEDKDYE